MRCLCMSARPADSTPNYSLVNIRRLRNYIFASIVSAHPNESFWIIGSVVSLANLDCATVEERFHDVVKINEMGIKAVDEAGAVDALEIQEQQFLSR
ncbi:hypothetical protein Anapl_18047 [Anas platyrhynchos]|uniref:Uncharacterized protein n=1 Tax=Anas platyrhynchos TaxID=8839 RepID=R0LRA8_ANAPL|nr:hypothetical protein Anapl_18047 [Anas platyrhynchos]